jgi:transcriptional regulator, tetR family
MAKAFSEEERIKIKEEIIKAALELFHDKGSRSLSIAKLTKKVGIAQGSFYNFWKDKEELIIDLMAYRSMQKLNNIEKELSNSLTDPTGFLSDIIYKYSLDMLQKIKTRNIYKDAFKIFTAQDKDKAKKIEKLYTEFLDRSIIYWKENNVVKNVNRQGLSDAFTGSFVFCLSYMHFNEETFEETLYIYIKSIVSRYIEV